MSQACRFQDDLLLFHYDELDPMARAHLEEHLRTCSSCREHLAQMSRLLDSITRPEMEISPAEINRFATRVAERAAPARTRRLPRPVWGGAMAAAAAVLVLIGILVTERPRLLPPVDRASTQIAELEILQRLELLYDFELLQDLELLEALEGRG